MEPLVIQYPAVMGVSHERSGTLFSDEFSGVLLRLHQLVLDGLRADAMRSGENALDALDRHAGSHIAHACMIVVTIA